MSKKSAPIIFLVTLLLFFVVFGKFNRMEEYRYKVANATYPWGEVKGSLFEASFNESQYLMGIDIVTKDISRGTIKIRNIYFKGKETGHSFKLKAESFDKHIVNNNAIIYCSDIVLPFESYTAFFTVVLSSDNKSIMENVSLDFEKDYKDYHYSIWDTWMGI